MADESNPWKTTSRKDVYENPWIKVTENQVINPSGNPGIYGVIHFKNLAVGIVVINAENDVCLVGQYRYALGRYCWEIPAGGKLHTDPETPLQAAKRELLEETGITAHDWKKLLDIDLSNSVTDERGIIFQAQDLRFGANNPGETELISIKWVPLDQVVHMIYSGEITDGLTIMGILAANRKT